MSDWIYGIHAVQAALEQHPASLEQVVLQDGAGRNARLQRIEQLARERGIGVDFQPRQALDDLVDGRHQGVVARARPVAAYAEDHLDVLAAQAREPLLLLVLDGIQDPHNLGACLRTADAAGAHGVVAPKDKSVGLTATVRKVACGAAEHVPFIQVTNLARCLERLKQMGVWITGTTPDAGQSLYELDFTGPSALVIGAEGKGLRRLTLAHCDHHAHLPMLGRVASLNASVATGVCLYEARRQRLAPARIASPRLTE